jgi:excisionase family DNA binding protein
MTRRLNWRAIKTHRNYTVDEAAGALGVHKGTVRRWLKNGLPALTDQRPTLILGSELVTFLKARRAPKQICRLDECFCFSCRTPRRPAFNAMEYMSLSDTGGNLRALCEVCTSVMHKRFSEKRLEDLHKLLEVTITQPSEHINERSQPSANVHFERKTQAHA